MGKSMGVPPVKTLAPSTIFPGAKENTYAIAPIFSGSFLADEGVCGFSRYASFFSRISILSFSS